MLHLGAEPTKRKQSISTKVPKSSGCISGKPATCSRRAGQIAPFGYQNIANERMGDSRLASTLPEERAKESGKTGGSWSASAFRNGNVYTCDRHAAYKRGRDIL